VGGAHSLAIKTDGTLWAFGDGNFGRLGQNNTINYSSPVQVGTDTFWTDAVPGSQFSIAFYQRTT
jgi:alpha-tubulin suppressor-like RCC1 family protein